MTVWWVNDPARLARERAEIAAIEGLWFENSDWSLDENFRLRLIFDIVLPHGRFRLSLVYHQTFPDTPPMIMPLDGKRLSSHQYGAEGELCLEIRNDNWDPSYTGAQMIESAHALLSIEAPNETGEITPAPSAHNFPAELALRRALSRFYISLSNRLELLRDDIDEAEISVGLDVSDTSSFIAHLFEIRKGKYKYISPDTPSVLREYHFVINGRIYEIGESQKKVMRVAKLGELRALVGERFALPDDQRWVCLIRSSESLNTLFCHFPNDEELVCYRTVNAPIEQSRSGDDCAGLASKRVAIIGLGSIGSKVAISLARAGVGRFELVDGGLLHIGNLERYDGDWRDVGRHKANLVARRLRLIRSGVECHAWRTAIGAQISAAEAGNVNAAIAESDLVIDATADPGVFNHLAGLTMRANNAFVWGAVFAGGVGAELARSRPEIDPSPYEIRGALMRAYGATEADLPRAAGRGYDGAAGDGPPITATDAAVATLAAWMTDFSIDTLLGTEPSYYNAHAYLVGMRRAWLFEGPFDTLPVVAEASPRSELPSAGQTPVDLEFVQSLFETLPDASQNTDKND